jgi:hypothetical protein
MPNEAVVKVQQAVDQPSAWWLTLWEFAVHVIVGTLLFLIIYAPAVGLNFLVHWMTSKEIDRFVIVVVQGAEYALIIADSALYLAFLIKTTCRGIKKL